MDRTSHSSDYADLLRELNDAGAEYIVVGAHAVAYHGYVRASRDIDVWVRPTPKNAERVRAALARFGAPLHELTLEDLVSDDLVFQIGVEPVRIDILTSVSGLKFDEAWLRRRHAEYMGVPASVLALEDLVANKRASGRLKDLADIEELNRITK